SSIPMRCRIFPCTGTLRHCVALLALSCAHVLPALRRCRRGISLSLDCPLAAFRRIGHISAWPEKDARVMSRCTDAGRPEKIAEPVLKSLQRFGACWRKPQIDTSIRIPDLPAALPSRRPYHWLVVVP